MAYSLELQSFLCVLLASTCLSEETPENNPRQWLHRKDVIKTFPPEIQKNLFKQALHEENVELTGEVPCDVQQLIPDLIEYLVNGAIDEYLTKEPVVGQSLGQIIKGGGDLLTTAFGGGKAYIPNLAPDIICPHNIHTYQDKGRLSTEVSWQEPIGYDVEDGVINSVQRLGPAPASRFSGDTIVKYTIRDSVGREDFCTFGVQVELIKCTEVPENENQVHSCRGKTLYYGDKCHFSCNEGYRMWGSSVLTCNRDGQFDGPAPTCNTYHCPEPALPPGGESWKCTQERYYGIYCIITCAPGYTNFLASDRPVWDQFSIRCQSNGTWTKMPECKKVN